MIVKTLIKNTLLVLYGAFQSLSKAALALMFLISQPALSESPTILALGDSLVQGYGLSHNDGFVPQLEKWLSDNGTPVNIINAGVSGDTTAGGSERILWSLNDNVDAIILALGSNDMLRGIDPSETRENLRKILEISKNFELKLMIIGTPASNNFGPLYKKKFDAIYPDLATDYNAMYLKNFFEAIMDPENPNLPQLQLLQPDRLHPNAEGISKIVEKIGPTVQGFITTR